MRVFVTGATGFVGSAVVKELIEAGHSVLGLSRSDAGAAQLQAGGAAVHRGSLEDLDSLRSGAAAADGVIHTAFIHDFSNFKESCAADGRAIEAIGAVLAGSDRPFVVTSGTLLLSPGALATEDLSIPAGTPVPRVSEQTALAMVPNGVRASVVRLSPSVHGDGDHGFVPALIGIARAKGEAGYIGDGTNRWPAVHRLDAAVLYRLALEKGEAGARYHGVGEEGIPFRDIAAAIGRRLDVPVVSKTAAQAPDHFGFLAHFAAIDGPAANAKTQADLGWKPTHKGLLADLAEGTYFDV
jgi:nucleoside-diphosphate-sugar epimerase